MEEKEVIETKKKRKFELDAFSILSIFVMLLSIGIAIYFILSFGK